MSIVDNKFRPGMYAGGGTQEWGGTHLGQVAGTSTQSGCNGCYNKYYGQSLGKANGDGGRHAVGTNAATGRWLWIAHNGTGVHPGFGNISSGGTFFRRQSDNKFNIRKGGNQAGDQGSAEYSAQQGAGNDLVVVLDHDVSGSEVYYYDSGGNELTTHNMEITSSTTYYLYSCSFDGVQHSWNCEPTIPTGV